MKQVICSNCKLINFGDISACERCKFALSDSEDPKPKTEVKTHRGMSGEEMVNGILWLLCTGWIFLCLSSMSKDLTHAESAPQQCAVAAINIGYLVGGYCVTRGLTSAFRSFAGK